MAKEKITKEMSIQEIIRINPKAAGVMMDFGMHCIGCMASQFESLEQGASAHGLSDLEIEELVKKMNDIKKE